MKTISSIIKIIIPDCILSFGIKLNSRQIHNYFNTKYTKKALLSYIVNPFKKTSLRHTNYYEAIAWGKILNELGYQVDVIQYNLCPSSLDLSQYDLICGFGDVFQHYFEGKNNNAITIYYATGMHVCHQNNATLQRVKNVHSKKGVWLGKSARFVEKTWSHQTTLVDGIIALGNNICKESYKKHYDGVVFSLPAPFYKTLDANLILNNKTSNSNRNFLWFGSSGLVHKGLDLLLDYFSKNKNLTLHICGPIMKEEDFVKVYQKELFESKNIINHGFINIQGDQFRKILESCYFVIFPSCSEGGAASVLTAIGNGGLIPIITKETTISTGYEIFIGTLDDNGIENAIREAISLDEGELLMLAKENLDFVLQNHSQGNYKDKLKFAITNILGDTF